MFLVGLQCDSSVSVGGWYYYLCLTAEDTEGQRSRVVSQCDPKGSNLCSLSLCQTELKWTEWESGRGRAGRTGGAGESETRAYAGAGILLPGQNTEQDTG